MTATNPLESSLENKIPKWREARKLLLRDGADLTVSRVSLGQMLKGLRGVNAVLCDTSVVDPEDGLIIRGIPVLDLVDRPAEEIFFLLCTGELPDAAAAEMLRIELVRRSAVPGYVWRMMDSMPEGTHPMALLSAAMLSMQRESVFLRKYNEGLPRTEYWRATLEDALNLIARLPAISAGIWRYKIRKLPRILPDATLGLSENYAHMHGLDQNNEVFTQFMRKFVVVHSDHEGAPASVYAARVIDSTLADLYYTLSGAMNCLSGPLHGLANQISLKLAQQIESEFSGVPSKVALRNYMQSFLNAGHVVPGFGHAVLRKQDPRYVALHAYGKITCAGSPLFRIIEKLGEVVPPLLIAQGKAKNPYPNIDGITGCMLYHYGIRDLEYYTVMFATAQAIGICAQMVLNRVVLSPIIRPRSVTTEWLQNLIEDSK